MAQERDEYGNIVEETMKDLNLNVNTVDPEVNGVETSQDTVEETSTVDEEDSDVVTTADEGTSIIDPETKQPIVVKEEMKVENNPKVIEPKQPTTGVESVEEDIRSLTTKEPSQPMPPPLEENQSTENLTIEETRTVREIDPNASASEKLAQAKEIEDEALNEIQGKLDKIDALEQKVSELSGEAVETTEVTQEKSVVVEDTPTVTDESVVENTVDDVNVQGQDYPQPYGNIIEETMSDLDLTPEQYDYAIQDIRVDLPDLRYPEVNTHGVDTTGITPFVPPNSVMGGSAYSEAELQEINKYSDFINSAAQANGISPEIITSMIATESSFNPVAKSGAGASGLMQLMPGTAKELGVTNPKDPAQNIQGGTRYFKQQLDTFKDTQLALMAYNWGPGNVRKWIASGRNPNAVPKETRDYIGKVLGRLGSGPSGTGVAPGVVGNAKQLHEYVVKNGLTKSSESTANGLSHEGTYATLINAKKMFGDDLVYSAALNDTYHANKNSAHRTGLAVDISLKNKSKENHALKTQQLAAYYQSLGLKTAVNTRSGDYDVFILDEAANASKDSTGAHIHVRFRDGASANKYYKAQASGQRLFNNSTGVQPFVPPQNAQSSLLEDAASQPVYRKAEGEPEPSVVTLENANYESMAARLGYTEIRGELGKADKARLYNEFARKLYDEEKAKYRGSGLSNQSVLAGQKVMKIMPDSYRAFNLDAPPVVESEEVRGYGVTSVKSQIKNIFGDDAQNLKMRDVVTQLATSSVNQRYKGSGLTSDTKKALIKEEIDAYYAGLGDIKSMTVGEFMNADAQTLQALQPQVDENGNVIQPVPESERDGAFAYGIDNAQDMAYKGVREGGRALKNLGLEKLGSWLERQGEEGSAQQAKDIAEGGYQSTYGSKSWEDTLDEDGVGGVIAKAFEVTLENAPQVGVGILTATGTVAASTVGLPVAATVATIGAGTGALMATGDLVSELEEKGVYDDNVSGANVLVGGVLGVIDSIPYAKGLSLAAKKTLGKRVMAEIAESGVYKKATQTASKNIATRATTGATKGVLTEAPTEVLQEAALVNIVEGRGGEYTDAEKRERYITSAVAGGTLGGAMGGVGGAVSSPTTTTTTTTPTTPEDSTPTTGTTPSTGVPTSAPIVDSIPTENGTLSVRADGTVSPSGEFTSPSGPIKPRNNKVYGEVEIDYDGRVTKLGEIGDETVRDYQQIPITNEYGNTKGFLTREEAEIEARARMKEEGFDETVSEFEIVPTEFVNADDQRVNGFKLVEVRGVEQDFTVSEGLSSGDPVRVQSATETILRSTGVQFTKSDDGVIRLTDIRTDSGTGSVTVRVAGMGGQATGSTDGAGTAGSVDGAGTTGSVDGAGTTGSADGAGTAGSVDGAGTTGSTDGAGTTGTTDFNPIAESVDLVGTQFQVVTEYDNTLTDDDATSVNDIVQLIDGVRDDVSSQNVNGAVSKIDEALTYLNDLSTRGVGNEDTTASIQDSIRELTNIKGALQVSTPTTEGDTAPTTEGDTAPTTEGDTAPTTEGDTAFGSDADIAEVIAEIGSITEDMVEEFNSTPDYLNDEESSNSYMSAMGEMNDLNDSLADMNDSEISNSLGRARTYLERVNELNNNELSQIEDFATRIMTLEIQLDPEFDPDADVNLDPAQPETVEDGRFAKVIYKNSNGNSTYKLNGAKSVAGRIKKATGNRIEVVETYKGSGEYQIEMYLPTAKEYFDDTFLSPTLDELVVIGTVSEFNASSKSTAGFFNWKNHVYILSDKHRDHSGLTAEEHMKFTAWHELGHRGLATNAGFEAYVDFLLKDGASHPAVQKIYNEISGKAWGNRKLSKSGYLEEAIVEIYAAVQTGTYDSLKRQYGITTELDGVQSLLAKFKQVLSELVRVITGKAVTQDEQLLQLFDTIRTSAPTRVLEPSELREIRNSRIGSDSEIGELVRYRNTESVESLSMALGNKSRREYKRLLQNKYRTDLSEDAIDGFLAELDKISDHTVEKATFKWFGNNKVIIPEDLPLIEQAVDLAKRKKVDPLSFDNPSEIIETHGGEVSAKPIDPDDVITLSNKKELSEGVVVYDVVDTDESRQNMREIINTHWGEDRNPWCLLQGDGEGNLTDDASHYWNQYSGTQKRVAFKNGKLLAFSASVTDGVTWWDRWDKPSPNIPIRGKIPNDEENRTADYGMNWETGELDTNYSNVSKGSRESGEYIEWYDSSDGGLPTTIKFIQNRNSEGQLDGVSEDYRPDGTIARRLNYKDGTNVGDAYESFYGTVIEGQYDENGNNDGKWTITRDGNLVEVKNFTNGELLTSVEYREDGSIIREVDVEANIDISYHEPSGDSIRGPIKIEKVVNEDGTISRTHYFSDGDDGQKGTVRVESLQNEDYEYISNVVYHGNGVPQLVEEFDSEGDISSKKQYDREGNLYSEENYKDGVLDGEQIHYSVMDGVKTVEFYYEGNYGDIEGDHYNIYKYDSNDNVIYRAYRDEYGLQYEDDGTYDSWSGETKPETTDDESYNESFQPLERVVMEPKTGNVDIIIDPQDVNKGLGDLLRIAHPTSALPTPTNDTLPEGTLTNLSGANTTTGGITSPNGVKVQTTTQQLAGGVDPTGGISPQFIPQGQDIEIGITTDFMRNDKGEVISEKTSFTNEDLIDAVKQGYVVVAVDSESRKNLNRFGKPTDIMYLGNDGEVKTIYSGVGNVWREFDAETNELTDKLDFKNNVRLYKGTDRYDLTIKKDTKGPNSLNLEVTHNGRPMAEKSYANIRYADKDGYSTHRTDKISITPIHDTVRIKRDQLGNIIFDAELARKSSGSPINIEGDGTILRYPSGTTVTLDQATDTIMVEMSDQPMREYKMSKDDNVAHLNLPDSNLVSTGNPIHTILSNGGEVVTGAESDSLFIEFNGERYRVGRDGRIYDKKGEYVDSSMFLPGVMTTKNLIEQQANEEEVTDAQMEIVVDTEIDEDNGVYQEVQDGYIITSTDGTYVHVVTGSDLSPLEKKKVAKEMVVNSKANMFNLMKVRNDTSELRGVTYTGSLEQRTFLNNLIAMFPDQISRIIDIEYDNLNNRLTKASANGAFMPSGVNGRGPRIMINAALHQHKGSTLKDVVDTISEEVGHFAFDQMSGQHFGPLLDIMWGHLETHITEQAELKPYIDRISPTGDLSNISVANKWLLVNEFLSKHGVAITDFMQEGMTSFADVDVNAIGRDLVNHVENNIVLPPGSDASGVAFTKQDFVQNVYVPFLRAQMQHATTSHGVKTEIVNQGNDTVVTITRRRYGTTERINTDSDEGRGILRDIERTEKFARGLISIRDFPTIREGVIEYIKYLFSELTRPRFGYTINDLLSRTSLLNAQFMRTTHRAAQDNIKEIQALLANHGFIGSVPIDKSYHDVFREWGIPDTPKYQQMAEQADHFIREAVREKYRNVLRIQNQFEEVNNFIVQNNTDMSPRELFKLRREVTAQQDRIKEEWTHRRYDVHNNIGGKDRLRTMRNMLRMEDVTKWDMDEMKLDEFFKRLQALDGSVDARDQLRGDSDGPIAYLGTLAGRYGGEYKENYDKLKANIDDVKKAQTDGNLSHQDALNQINELVYNFAVRNKIDDPKLVRDLEKVQETMWLQDRLAALAEYTRLEMVRDGVRRDDNWNKELFSRMNAEIESYLLDGESFGSNIPNSIASKDANKKRKLDPNNHVDQLKMEFLGELNDPMESLLIDLTQQHELLASITNMNLLGKELIRTNVGNLKLNPDEKRKFGGGQFQGSIMDYVELPSPAVVDHMKRSVDALKLAEREGLAKIVTTAKAGWTVYNVKNGIMNWFGNISLLALNGTLLQVATNPGRYKNALTNAIKGAGRVAEMNYNPEKFEGRADPLQNVIQEMIENGLIGSSLDTFMADWTRGNYTEQLTIGLGRLTTTDPRKKDIRANRVKSTLEVIKGLYGAGDDAIKVLPYIMNREVGVKRARAKIKNFDLSTQQGRVDYERRVQEMAVRYATEQTNRETVNYSLTPLKVKEWVNSPSPMMIAGDFMTHPTQFLRIVMDQFYKMREDHTELKEVKQQMRDEPNNQHLKEYYEELAKRQLNRIIGNGFIHTSLAAQALGMSAGWFSTMVNMVIQGMWQDDAEDDDELYALDISEHTALTNALAYWTPDGMPYYGAGMLATKNQVYLTNANRYDIMHSLFARPGFDPEASIPDQAAHAVMDVFANFANVSGGSIASDIMSLARMQDPFTGDKITADESAKQLVKMMVPTTISSVSEIVTGQSKYGTPINRGAKVAENLTGFQVQAVNTDEYLIGRMASKMEASYRFSDAIMDTTPKASAFKKQLESGVAMSDAEIVSGIQDVISERKKTFNEMQYLRRQYLRAGVGITDTRIEEVFDKKSVSTNARRSILEGEFLGYETLINSVSSRLENIESGKKQFARLSPEDVEVVKSNYETMLEKLEDYE